MFHPAHGYLCVCGDIYIYVYIIICTHTHIYVYTYVYCIHLHVYMSPSNISAQSALCLLLGLSLGPQRIHSQGILLQGYRNPQVPGHGLRVSNTFPGIPRHASIYLYLGKPGPSNLLRTSTLESRWVKLLDVHINAVIGNGEWPRARNVRPWGCSHEPFMRARPRRDQEDQFLSPNSTVLIMLGFDPSTTPHIHQILSRTFSPFNSSEQPRVGHTE